MRDLTIVLLSVSMLALSVGHYMQEMRITNLERQASRIEQAYQTVIAESQRLQRINEQNLLLLSKGGWR